jgi:hypothetical protein
MSSHRSALPTNLLDSAAYRAVIDEFFNVEPDIWAALERTYVGAGISANWDALFQTIELFRTVAVEVGDQLGHIYPYDMDQRVLAYLQKLQGLNRPAEPFGGRS